MATKSRALEYFRARRPEPVGDALPSTIQTLGLGARQHEPSAPADGDRALADTAAPSADDGAPSIPSAACPESGPSLHRDVLRAKVERDLLGAADNPVKIGRFVVIDRLGRGAMGVVLRAFDPMLDRKVAIKLVDPSRLGTGGHDAQGRLEREARAAADLTHPNVVTVYDVGRHDGGVFLAMEYVEGETLTQWMSEPGRSWRAIVEMFVQIAAGLSAAHEAGIIHRDFKPDNVLVGADGRPRVADFGLARPVEGWSVHDSQRRDGGPSGPRDSAAELASTGEVCGTPAYMAPEQFAGHEVGPASDQFGFCTSLYEALFGERPFRGRSLTELASNVMDGRVRSVPERHGIPRALVSIVVRGLHSSPEGRHRSVAELADKLSALVRTRRRRMLASGIAGVAVFGLAGGYQVAAANHVDPCEAIDGPLAATWGAGRRQAVEDALLAWSSPGASRLLGALDGFAAQWSEQRNASCQATLVRGEQSDFAHALRMACLDRAAAQLDGITEEMAVPGPQTDPESLAALLPNLTACQDVHELERSGDRFQTSGLTPAKLEARMIADRLLGQADARQLLGRPGARGLLERTVELARGADDWTLEGLALAELGEMDLEAGELQAAKENLDASIGLAIATSHDDQAARATLSRADLALRNNDPDAAQLHLGYARAFLDRVQDPQMQEDLSASHRVLRAKILLRAGDFAEARDVLLSLVEVADARAGTELVNARSELAIAFKGLGEIELAIEQWHAALRLHRTIGGGASKVEAGLRVNLGIGLTLLRQFDEAERHFAVGVDIVEELHGPRDETVAMTLLNWGWMATERGDVVGARRRIEEGLAIIEEEFPDGHGAIPFALERLAELDRLAGDYGPALHKLNRAGQLRDALFGAEHPSLADTLTLMGHVYLDRGEPEDAEAPLRTALELRAGSSVAPQDLGETQLVMALVRRQTDPAAAAELAAEARKNLQGPMPPSSRVQSDLDAWDAALTQPEGSGSSD